jgi:sterol desaturase/sphingolipid hydroxylase (fatty acid hydroxylase superfamily)
MRPISSFPDLLRLVLRSFVTQTGAYFVVIGVLFGAIWIAGASVFAARKLQKKRRVDGRQLRFELGHTLRTLAAGTLSATGVIAVVSTGHGRFTNDIAAAGGAICVVVSFVAMNLFNDLWFYGWHRPLHTHWWFRHVHAVHHKSVDMNPFSSYSFHFFEAFILSAWFIPATLVLPLYLPAVGALQLVVIANNLVSHLGYEFLPRWLLRVPVLQLTNTSTFHNLHHIQFNGNYGLHTRVWDRLFGTEVEGYERAFLARDVTASGDERNPACSAFLFASHASDVMSSAGGMSGKGR